MMMLGNMLEYQLRDYDGARAMFQAAISTGHPESGPEAMFLLGHLLQRTGDDDEAKAAYQYLADSGPPGSRAARCASWLISCSCVAIAAGPRRRVAADPWTPEAGDRAEGSVGPAEPARHRR
jgi:hypothetical protein